MANTAKAPSRGPATKKAARRSAGEWAVEVADWRRSGERAGDYAATRGISAASLTWWSSQLAKKRQGDSVGTCSAFLPVRVGAGGQAARSAAITGLRAEVILAGGRCVRVTGELTLSQFARLLDVVDGVQSC